MKLVAQNNKVTFWTNDWTDSAEKYAKQLNVQVKCLVAEQKGDGVREYILVEDGKIIYSNQQYEAIGIRIDILGLLKVK